MARETPLKGYGIMLAGYSCLKSTLPDALHLPAVFFPQEGYSALTLKILAVPTRNSVTKQHVGFRCAAKLAIYSCLNQKLTYA